MLCRYFGEFEDADERVVMQSSDSLVCGCSSIFLVAFGPREVDLNSSGLFDLPDDSSLLANDARVEIRWDSQLGRGDRCNELVSLGSENLLKRVNL